MPKTKPKKTGRTTLKIDFSDTESRGGQKSKRGRRIKPGDYRVVVSKAPTTGKSPEKKTPYAEFTYKILDGKYKGTEIEDRCYLSPSALWRLRNALEAMGIKVPSKAVNIDLSKCKGKELGITIDDEEKGDKVYSNVVDTFKAELVEESDDEDEDEDDEDEDDEEEDEDEEDEDEEDEDDDEDDEEDDDEEDDLDLDDI